MSIRRVPTRTDFDLVSSSLRLPSRYSFLFATWLATRPLDHGRPRVAIHIYSSRPGVFVLVLLVQTRYPFFSLFGSKVLPLSTLWSSSINLHIIQRPLRSRSFFATEEGQPATRRLSSTSFILLLPLVLRPRSSQACPSLISRSGRSILLKPSYQKNFNVPQKVSEMRDCRFLESREMTLEDLLFFFFSFLLLLPPSNHHELPLPSTKTLSLISTQHGLPTRTRRQQSESDRID